jgi:hypothetical protein
MTEQTDEQVKAAHDIEAAEKAKADAAAAHTSLERETLANEFLLEDKPETAKTRLRAFEDATFGLDASRINGEVERGIGSPFARMTHEQKAHHAALEHLVKAEQAMADASAALAAAQARHDAAVKMSEQAARMLDTPTDQPVRKPLPFGADDHEVV